MQTSKMGCVVAPMKGDDFDWAADVMDQRRARYEEFSPIFWRPAPNAKNQHASFMRSVADRPDAVALRTRHGFLLSSGNGGRCMVDDFAVEADEQWATEGKELLLAVWAQRPREQAVLRVVTARQDTPKSDLLRGLGLVASARWWVKELAPAAPSSTFGLVELGSARALFAPAPPVYDPGGPVCLLGDVAAEVAIELSEEAERRGAVLAVVQRDRSPGQAPASEPVLEEAGFHNPSEFFDGALSAPS